MEQVNALFDLFSRYLINDETAHTIRNGAAEFLCPNQSCSSHAKTGKKRIKFSINFEKGVYNCWCCAEAGRLDFLAKRFFTKSELTEFYVLWREVSSIPHIERSNEVSISDFVPMFENMYTGVEFDMVKLDALKYLRKRGVTDDMIAFYGIKYSRHKNFNGYIIFPSHNANDDVDFFCARSVGDKGHYKFPKMQKGDVIFNERFIDWSSELILVEGAFDYMAMHGYNRTALLGTTVGKRLFGKIIENRTKVNICIDPDAIQKAFTIASKLSSWGISVRISTDLIKQHGYKDVGEITSTDVKSTIITQAPPYDAMEMIRQKIRDFAY